MKRATLLALALALVLTALPWENNTAAAYDVVYVQPEMLNVRTAPSMSAPVALIVYQGDQVGIVGAVQGEWVAGSATWYRTISGYYVAAAYLGGAPATPRATASARGDGVSNPGYSGRWVDVNLSSLRARAMVGNTVAYVAPVTTGKAGWRTPTGTFSVLRRFRYDDMDAATIGVPLGSAESYYVKDVPYVQYFDNAGDALHGSYWSPANSFGNYNASHGCVSMRVGDAAYFWNFGYLGMPVVVHY